MSTKQLLMGAAELRTQIHHQLEKVQDERFLKVIHSMLDTYMEGQEEEEIGRIIESMPPPPGLEMPETKEELMAELDEANAQIERGEYITLEDLEKEMEQW
ncbi:MAG: hypothetical protein AAF798_18580 [Bacteroidota bacterium]